MGQNPRKEVAKMSLDRRSEMQTDKRYVQADGSQIKQLRTTTFLTQEQFWEKKLKEKISKRTYDRAEASGRVRLETIRIIAETHGVPPEELVISGTFPVATTPAAKLSSPSNPRQPDNDPFQSLSRSKLTNAFRIPVEDSHREERVAELVAEERSRSGERTFRLLASSGYNYLHHLGKVWRAGLGEAITQSEAELQVVLASTSSAFAIARALANGVEYDQWKDKVTPRRLEEVDGYDNVTIRVTEHPILCSLFFTSEAVFFDPYLLAKPKTSERTENNFLVLEFRRADDKRYDCYSILKMHFDFYWRESVSLKDFIGEGRKRYNRLSQEFSRKIRELRS